MNEDKGTSSASGKGVGCRLLTPRLNDEVQLPTIRKVTTFWSSFLNAILFYLDYKFTVILKLVISDMIVHCTD